MSRLHHFSVYFAKYYIHIYTSTVFPVLCLGVQLPIFIHQQKYKDLPLLFLFPVGYSAYSLGLNMVENMENNSKSKSKSKSK